MDAVMKRAVSYLRVSTKEQARRDGNPEGYSLPTQRHTVQAKAEALGAMIVHEYLDTDTGTRTDKRPDMQRLLERVRAEGDIDYVIVFKLDRWARNAREDLVNDFILEQAGAELVSCSEPIDRSNAGRMQHIVLAGMNEYHSRNMGDEIKRKTLQKIKDGGSHGCARIGYKNVGEGGRRYVVVDPERAPLITWLFEAYATGEWSVDRLLEELTARGLRSRGGPNTPSKPLTVSALHRILRSPYYRGVVVFNGVEYQGKHETLIDDDTWQRVQDVLSSKRQGEKQRQHHHYLKGTIWCGHCGSRLVVTYSRGKSGQRYPYYFCVGRHQKRTTCMLTYRPLDVVEAAIEDHYARVQLTAEGLERAGAALLAEVAALAAFEREDHQRQVSRLQQLDDERRLLLQAHYAGAVPLDLLKQEQDRISNEMKIATARLSGASRGVKVIERTISAAVERATNCHRTYMEAVASERRLMNQAFFRRIWVTEEGVVGWDYSDPFATLMAVHGAPVECFPVGVPTVFEPPVDDRTKNDRVYLRRSPGWWAGAVDCGLVRSLPLSRSSKAAHLAESEGFEPSVGRTHNGFRERAPGVSSATL